MVQQPLRHRLQTCLDTNHDSLMAVLSLPLSFTNSFWSQDYRKGLETVFAKLEQGSQENDEIITFIRVILGITTAILISNNTGNLVSCSGRVTASSLSDTPRAHW